MPGGGPSRGRAHTYDPRAGWTSSALVTEADGCRGDVTRPGKLGQPLRDTARRKLGRTFQMGKISWQTCRFQKEAGAMILNIPMCLTPSLLPWNQTAQRGRVGDPRLGPGSGSTAVNWR